MPKEKHDSIEQFFKKALSHEDKTHMEQDWKNLEKMLDDQDVATPTFFQTSRPWIAIILLGVVLTSSVLYFTTTRDVTEADQIISESKVQAAPDKVVPQTSTKDSEGIARLHSASDNRTATTPSSSTEDKSPQQANESSPINSRGGLSKPSSEIEASKADTRSGESKQESKNVSQDKLRSPMAEKSHELPQVPAADRQRADIVISGVTATELDGKANADENSESRSTQGNNDAVKSISGIDKSNTVASVVIDSLDRDKSAGIAEANEEPKADKEDDLPSRQTRWSIAGLIAPDFSTTNFASMTSPGTAFGLLLSFRLTDRLFVRAGWLRTSKKYKGEGYEYQPPPGYWDYKTNGVVPDEIAGNCSVNEIPIVIRYDFVSTPRSKWYASAGLSNYKMTSESYTYAFNSENPGAASGWSSDTPSSYGFSVGHFSLGYERVISRHLSIAAEPFVKIPFKGIGWSNVNLYTTGAYFSVRYTLNKSGVTNNE